MSACRRFEEEGLLRLEEGLPLDDHFRSCPDCSNARSAYDRLRRDIASLGPFDAPAGWDTRLRSRIARLSSAGKPSPWWLAAGAATAATILAVVVIPALLRMAAAPVLRQEILPASEPAQRGQVASGAPVLPGSRWLLTAETGGAPHAELRVYRNTDLIVQVTRASSGARADERLRALVLLDAIGRYQAALFTSRKPIPAPSGALDADFSTARAAGTKVQMTSEVTVR
jgi:hypothetical protein